MLRVKKLLATMLATSMILSDFNGLSIQAKAAGQEKAETAVSTEKTSDISTSSMSEDGTTFTNPMSYTDVPDMDVIRVGDTYYMISTTMHLSPGCPVMKSKDLVNWEIVNYVYDILEDSDACSLENGQSMYGKGQWAGSLRYNNGIYYVAFACYTTNKTYIYQTKDIENGSWTRSELSGVYHDLSLLFDDDGSVYMIYGSGTVKLVELTEDATAIKEDGLNTTLIADTSGGRASNQIILPGEGSHIQKINGKYYIFMIGWYYNGGSEYANGRMELCFRSDSIDGEYERKEVLNDSGIAQGGIIDTEDGAWYGLLFKDNQSVGRTPYLVPVTWENEWPVFGQDGKVPTEMTIPVEGYDSSSLVESDEFYQGSEHKTYSTETSTTATSGSSSSDLISNGGFEDGTTNWTTNNSATIKSDTDEKASGEASAFVTNRTSTTSGPLQDITGKVVAGQTYQLSAKVKYTTGPDTKTFNMCIKLGGSYSSSYNPVTVMTSVTAKKGEWTTISGSYTIPEDGDLSVTDIFIETAYSSNPDTENDLMDFYVDDISVVGESGSSDDSSENAYNGSNLNLVWQWNHNPNNNNWSLTDRLGYLRLTTGSISTGLLDARNTLTQRTFGPQCSGTVSLDVSNMKNGDVAGLSAFQYYYGYVGVKMTGNKKYLVMQKKYENDGTDVEEEIESVECTKDTVYLKIDFDFTNNNGSYTDKAYFYYSYDGVNWTKIGDALSMSYSLKVFMGYRFGLFNYSTLTTGGYVDFDYFRVDDTLTGDEDTATVLTASMEDQTIIYEQGDEIAVPLYIDPLQQSTTNLEASVEIPEGFEVSDVTFNQDNITGTGTYTYNDNGQLLLNISGESVNIESASQKVATIKIKSKDTITKNTEATVKVDYISAKGADSIYDVNSAVSHIILTWFDEDSIGKAIGTSNPLITQKYGADPYALVYDGRVYIYMTSDAYEYDSNGEIATNSYSSIKTISVISSSDMVNWTDHGEIKVAGSDGAATWASNSWAPAVAHKVIDGKDKFFLYYANNASSIGVLTADSPVGPWTDPIGKSLIDRSVDGVDGVVWCFDPAVLVDDDGTGYLYFGGGVDDDVNNPKTSRVIQLGDDMISTVGSAVEIDAPAIFEDSGIHKYNGTYYYSYCSNFSSHADGYPGTGVICYMTSDSPMGPFEYQGEILQNPGSFFGVGGNNHHAIFEFNGEWYITYHTQTLSTALGIQKGYRSTQINKITYNEDGTIQPVTADMQGVSSVANISAYTREEAETIAWNSGLSTTECSQPGNLVTTNNMELTNINAGDWIGISNVEFGEQGANKFITSVASVKGGSIDIHLDSPSGEVIGTLEVGTTGGEDSWQEISCETKNVTGVHDVYFTFMGNGSENLFNMDYWMFEEKAVEVTNVTLNKSALTLDIGKTETLVATITPQNAADKTVTWKSNNTKVATVSEGKVTAVAAGTATITATVGGISASCKVTVKKATVAVSSVTLNQKKVTLTVGKTVQLSAKVNPSNATNKTIAWSTSNKKVATVVNGKVKAVGVGTATITATAGGKKATCTVVVKPIAVTKVSLNKKKVTTIVGTKVKLTATITPSNATNKKVTWKTSNKKIATVNKNGVVTALKAGTVTITASASGKTATCKVTVKAKPSIKVTTKKILSGKKKATTVNGTITVKKGDRLKVTSTKVNLSGKITYTLDKNAKKYLKISNKSGGKTTITVKKAGNVTCKVTVKCNGKTSVIRIRIKK